MDKLHVVDRLEDARSGCCVPSVDLIKNLDFSIPFDATFELVNGSLIMKENRNPLGASLKINNNGELEVIV